MREAPTARIVLFVVVSATLVAAAISFSRGAGWTGAEQEASGGAGPADARAQTLAAQLAQADAEVKATARRFLAAFLRYEVGELTPALRRVLRATATPEFGRQLLAFPTRRPPGNFPPRAELRRVDVTFVSPQATLAVVSGTALRAGRPEEFGFVFTQSASGWLASGAAE